MTPEPGGFRGAERAKSEDARQARSFGRYAGVGLQFAVAILVFLYAGQWVDRRFGWAPWGMIVGVFTGAIRCRSQGWWHCAQLLIELKPPACITPGKLWACAQNCNGSTEGRLSNVIRPTHNPFPAAAGTKTDASSHGIGQELGVT